MKNRTNTTVIDIIPNVDTPLMSSSPLVFAKSFKNETSKESSDSNSNENPEIWDQFFIGTTPKLVDSSDNENVDINPRLKATFNPILVESTTIEVDNTNLHSEESKNNILSKVLPSTIVSIGTGLAMMPIFNNVVKNSEDFGIDIHSNKGLFIASTANTFIIASLSSFSNIYHFIEKYQTQVNSSLPNNSYETKDLVIILSKIAASWSTILPLGLLWGVELQNQKIAESEGFDKFIAWATFTTIPLVADRIVESVKAVNEIYDSSTNADISTIGSKLVVYGLAGLSIAGRALAYTEVTKVMGLAMGLDETAALSVGIVAGGILGSGGITIFEYKAVKSLFEPQEEPWTIRKVAVGVASAIEGAWFTLPIVALGLNATEGWNPLLKGALFTPLFVSHSIFEATKLYDNILMSYDSIYEGVSSLMGDNSDFNYDDSYVA